MNKLVGSLKKAKSRVPYFSVKLPEEKITDLKIRGEATILLGLRFNYPLMCGIQYDKDNMATIVGKTNKGKFYEYKLVTK